jgi:hypothetical protein
MTAKLRAGMRLKRHNNALTLLRHGEARAEVARSVILSPSRISAMFKGQTFPTKKALLNSDPTILIVAMRMKAMTTKLVDNNFRCQVPKTLTPGQRGSESDRRRLSPTPRSENSIGNSSISVSATDDGTAAVISKPAGKSFRTAKK